MNVGRVYRPLGCETATVTMLATLIQYILAALVAVMCEDNQADIGVFIGDDCAEWVDRLVSLGMAR